MLEWDPLDLATSELRSLSLYRNGTKAGVIPKDKLSTKISGLALDTEYTFHLVLRTSAGQYSSERLTVRTHKMTDLSGITVTPGVMPPQLKDSLAETVERIGAKYAETIRIDTTHFVCTEPRGQAWEKAVEMNVPVVVPDWLKGCEREGRLVGVRGYYLDADPKLRQMGQPSQQVLAAQRLSVGAPQARDSPRIEHTPPTPERSTQGGEGFGGQGTSEPPTPPPKPAEERLAEERAEDEAEQTRGEVARPTVLSKETEVEDDDDDESDSTEQGRESRDIESPEPQMKTKPAPAESDEDDDDDSSERGNKDDKFDEVAL